MPPTDDLQAQLDASQEEAETLKGEKEELEGRLAKAEEEASQKKPASKTKDGGKEDGETGESRKSEIDKSQLDPAVRAALEKAEADTAAAAAKAATAEALAKTERDRRLDKEFFDKAEGYHFLGADTGELGPLLKSANETLSKEDYERLEGILSAANEQIRQGDLFKQMGTDDQHGEPGDALQEVTRKAEELRKSDSSLSMEKAMERVMEGDKALQQRYLAEVR